MVDINKIIKNNKMEQTKTQEAKQVKDMTKKELLREWRDIEFHIRNLGCGRSEIYYRAELESEMHARGIMW